MPFVTVNENVKTDPPAVEVTAVAVNGALNVNTFPVILHDIAVLIFVIPVQT
jgi:hypothetical protein